MAKMIKTSTKRTLKAKTKVGKKLVRKTARKS